MLYVTRRTFLYILRKGMSFFLLRVWNIKSIILAIFDIISQAIGVVKSQYPDSLSRNRVMLVMENSCSKSVYEYSDWRNRFCVSVETPARCSFVIEFIIPKFYWRLNMFRAAHRSSSGALNCICRLWFIYTCGDRPLPRLSLGNGRSPYVCINQSLQIQFRAPDDERCAARNMLSL